MKSRKPRENVDGKRAGRTGRALPPVLGLALATAAMAAPVLRTHNDMMLAWRATGVDPTDVDAMFAHVLAGLGDSVDVLPTENYFYWQLTLDGREWRGNFRLAPDERASGRLAFAYSEWEEFPGPDRPDRLRREKSFPVLERGADDFTWVATHGSRRVVFNLHRVPQHPPARPALAPGERFVQRTFDESGLGFLLLFDERTREFRWILDEERPVPEHWRELDRHLVQGRRTGFVFAESRGRKHLVAVRGQSVDRNDPYDGPFDQLADNYAADSPLRECLERWDPQLRGHIDAFGRFTDERAPLRVAIAPYSTYYSVAEAIRAGKS